MTEWMTDQTDGDAWYDFETYASREEAIAAGRALYGGKPFRIGIAVPYKPRVDAYGFLQDIVVRTYDDMGEVADGWLDIPYDAPEVAELKERLQETFDEWLSETGHDPSFFRVTDVEQIEGETNE